VRGLLHRCHHNFHGRCHPFCPSRSVLCRVHDNKERFVKQIVVADRVRWKCWATTDARAQFLNVGDVDCQTQYCTLGVFERVEASSKSWYHKGPLDSTKAIVDRPWRRCWSEAICGEAYKEETRPQSFRDYQKTRTDQTSVTCHVFFFSYFFLFFFGLFGPRLLEHLVQCRLRFDEYISSTAARTRPTNSGAHLLGRDPLGRDPPSNSL
jgi:hypothetical protein